MQRSPYDDLAWFYDRYWASQYRDKVYPVLEQWLLPQLPERAHILDLCCGTGQLAARLTEQGFRVTGVDNSTEMLAFARRNAPLAGFVESSAERFSLTEPAHAAVSLYDSLNHLMTEERLLAAFAATFASLANGGIFLFDLNIEPGYLAGWKGSWAIVEDDHLLAARSSYDVERKRGELKTTMFRLDAKGWQRTDAHFEQTAFAPESVTQLLTSVGFILRKTGPPADFGLTMSGRQFWLVEKHH